MSSDNGPVGYQLVLPNYENYCFGKRDSITQEKPHKGQAGKGRQKRDSRTVEAFIEQAGFYGTLYLGKMEVDVNSNIWCSVS